MPAWLIKIIDNKSTCYQYRVFFFICFYRRLQFAFLMAHSIVRNTVSKLLKERNITKSFFCKMSGSSLPKVFVTRNDFPPGGIDLLKSKCDVEEWDFLKHGPISKNDFLSKVKDVDALFVEVANKIDEELINAAGSKLKVVSTCSVGVDHVNLKLLKERGIKLGYTPNVLTEATAELTVALLLATSRRLFEANHELTSGGWQSWSPSWMCGQGLECSTVGIVGLGRIGQSVARKLLMFQIDKLLYTSRSDKPEAVALGAERTSLEDLLKRSDFVVVTTALTPETQHLFNSERFALMKPTSIFINISRGGVVDQNALIDALEKGKIGAAGLDVMTPEPLPTDHKLHKLKNCCLLPHIGSATIRSRSSMSALTARNILAALEGKKLPAEYPL